MQQPGRLYTDTGENAPLKKLMDTQEKSICFTAQYCTSGITITRQLPWPSAAEQETKQAHHT